MNLNQQKLKVLLLKLIIITCVEDDIADVVDDDIADVVVSEENKTARSDETNRHTSA